MGGGGGGGRGVGPATSGVEAPPDGPKEANHDGSFSDFKISRSNAGSRFCCRCCCCDPRKNRLPSAASSRRLSRGEWSMANSVVNFLGTVLPYRSGAP